ncbi:MAG TPA: rhomboid family intramembrane serine protease [Candidatus Sumerlaeota bacterium]|nr:MAG: Rhomboid protease GluP [candidate division BRC1 bacterium ADurb.BinA292]HOE96002.1 rhomboid family intramembrane serine protease [Candidatus Sumerlaeota bacterium]HOR28404.1 rhomboid family intramembrane serine protease [Candidatus Sumerlaeota bacterium]HPK03273.1 rhomboid family intramembrane serine protease [Candidatus Sumerlaeota bacterium]
MLPLRDNIPPRTRPLANYLLILVTSVCFIGQFRAGDGEAGQRIVETFGLIPARVIYPEAALLMPEERVVMTRLGPLVEQTTRRIPPLPFSPLWTFLTSIFLHGGLLHFLGNMWFLFIFGDNVEDRLGHARYLLFYLACGVLAGLAHFSFQMESIVPTIGASGAIAGVMGAYLVLYPHARVLAIVPVFVLLYTVVVPAPIFLGVWFLIQLVQGAIGLGSLEMEGVAWWAHIGGFAAGIAAVIVLKALGQLRPPVKHIIPGTRHMRGIRARF